MLGRKFKKYEQIEEPIIRQPLLVQNQNQQSQNQRSSSPHEATPTKIDLITPTKTKQSPTNLNNILSADTFHSNDMKSCNVLSHNCVRLAIAYVFVECLDIPPPKNGLVEKEPLQSFQELSIFQLVPQGQY